MTVDDIITDISVFRDDYIPDTIHYREEQLRQLELVFQRGEGHLVILGETGTGKTLAVKTAMQHYDVSCEYIQCRDGWGQKAVMTKLADAYHISYNVKKETAEDIWRKTVTKLPERLFIIMDDIDRVRQHDICPVLKLVDTTDICWILVTNQLDLFRKIENRCKDVMHRIAPNYISFPPYNMQQLYEILQDRSNDGLVPEAWEHKHLTKIAQSIHWTGDGDARAAIQALKKAADIAVKNERDYIVTTDVEEAVEEVLAENICRLVDALPGSERELLRLVLKYPKRRFIEYFKRYARKSFRPVNKGNTWKCFTHLSNINLLIPEDRAGKTIYVPNMTTEARDKILDRLKENEECKYDD